jgi:hypothetical protein
MNHDQGRTPKMHDHLCPHVISLDAAEKVIDDFEHIHESPTVSRGVIALSRRTAERVHELYPCDGPVSDNQGRVTCPLYGIISDVVGMAELVPATPSYAIPPEKVMAAEGDRQTGQYL